MELLKIYVADAGNSRLVRVDNLGGANWTAFGTAGSGLNQFSGMNAVTLDTTGHIYIADTYNNRIARIDDMLGANWTVLGSSRSVSFINPYGVAVDPYGILYIADSRSYLGTLVTVSPLSLNFGTIPAGGFGSSLTVTVANPSAAPAAISSIVLTAAPIYRLKNPCPATLAAGSSCTLTVKFIPQNAGIYNGYLTVTDGARIPQKVTITGTGTSN